MIRRNIYEAKQAVKRLLYFIGENPSREGLINTPKRIIRFYMNFFKGYEKKPKIILRKNFREMENYNDIILIKNIQFISFCEHHIIPIIGKTHIAYIPNKKIVGISKIARLVDALSHRLQTQERLTMQITNNIEKIIDPKGTAVIMNARHQCMTIRGIKKNQSETTTNCMKGLFNNNKFIYKLIYLINQ